MSKSEKKKNPGSEMDPQFPLAPHYSKEEDIYNKDKKEEFTEDGAKDQNEIAEQLQNPGADLDIPGAELDDASEIIGEEDEENNYYSLGGDNHEDLEEDNE